jgi:hypothetical protein
MLFNEGITFSIILGDYGLSKNENIAFQTFHWQLLISKIRRQDHNTSKITRGNLLVLCMYMVFYKHFE